MKNKAGLGVTIVWSVFTFSREASFSYKISDSYSTQISIVFRLNVFLSKHLFEIVLFAFYLQYVSVKNGGDGLFLKNGNRKMFSTQLAMYLCISNILKRSS